MNCLLLEPGEIGADGRCVVRGRRHAHLRDVLRASPGRELKAGVLGGMLGAAVLERMTTDDATLRVTLTAEPPPADDVLLLAVPRPKVLLRMLAHAAALGFGRVLLFRSWRVDKSWLTSSAMDAAVQREQLVLGLEQAGRTRVPEVRFFDRFRPMVEDALPALGLPPARFVAHPTARTPTAMVARLASAPFAVALGPDGGFLPYEVDRLSALAFHPVSCGPHPLRTETALAVLWGQLDLLRARRTVTA